MSAPPSISDCFPPWLIWPARKHLIPLRCLCSAVLAAVDIGLPDALSSEPQSVEALAQATGTHAPTLTLLLRALASLGIFAEVAAEVPTFTHTERSRALRTAAAGSMRDLV